MKRLFILTAYAESRGGGGESGSGGGNNQAGVDSSINNV